GQSNVESAQTYATPTQTPPRPKKKTPPPPFFTDVGDTIFDSTIRYDETFFSNLDHVIQREPWLERDRSMIDTLRSLGIERFKAFSPGPNAKLALAAGAREAHDWLEAKYDVALPPFSEGGHWNYPAPPELVKAAASDFADPERMPVDARGLAYHYAYVGIKHLGTGQFYLISIKDKQGHGYDGKKTYRLNVPANAPVELYWSVTAYDR